MVAIEGTAEHDASGDSQVDEPVVIHVDGFSIRFFHGVDDDCLKCRIVQSVRNGMSEVEDGDDECPVIRWVNGDGHPKKTDDLNHLANL